MRKVADAAGSKDGAERDGRLFAFEVACVDGGGINGAEHKERPNEVNEESDDAAAQDGEADSLKVPFHVGGKARDHILKAERYYEDGQGKEGIFWRRIEKVSGVDAGEAEGDHPEVSNDEADHEDSVEKVDWTGAKIDNVAKEGGEKERGRWSWQVDVEERGDDGRKNGPAGCRIGDKEGIEEEEVGKPSCVAPLFAKGFLSHGDEVDLVFKPSVDFDEEEACESHESPGEEEHGEGGEKTGKAREYRKG